MATPTAGGASTFVFPGSAQRRRSSLDVPMDISESQPPLLKRVENPLLHNLRTPLTSTQNNSMNSPPLVPFSPFSPPPSLREPSKFVSALSTSTAWDTENRGFIEVQPSLGLRQRKTTKGAAAWNMSAPEETKPDRILPKTSYSLGTNYYVPVSKSTQVLSTAGAPTIEITSLSDTGRSERHVGTKDASNSFSFSMHPIPLATAITDSFVRPTIPAKAPECNTATTILPPVPHATLTEDDILNYPDSTPLAISSSNCSFWEQLLHCLFGMDDDCEQRQKGSLAPIVVPMDQILR